MPETAARWDPRPLPNPGIFRAAGPGNPLHRTPGLMFATVVLYIWPVVVLVLFRNCSAATALLASLLGGYLLLPTLTSLELPGLPTLNKDTIPAIAAFAIAALMPSVRATASLRGWVPRGVLVNLLILALIAAAFLTVMTNGDLLNYGPRTLPALRPWDAFSNILATLTMLLPLFLGRRLLAHPDQQRRVLVALAIAGVAYALLALYEVRMSPQLNNMVYGFFPHSFLQHIRDGGFRPIVFLTHGLWLSIFFSGTTLAAFGLARLSQGRQRTLFLGAGLWLLLTLVLSKSLGALVITLTLAPVVFFLRRRSQMMIAAGLAAVVLIYPMLRGADLVPVERAVELVESVSPRGAASLEFRIQNEGLFLEKARERLLFGWGGWGRNFVINNEGQSISVPDGYWVLIIGQGGWLRYLAEFGLLCIPVLLAVWHARRYELGLETSVLVLILAGNLVDLIPNATITPLTWMIAGAVWGRLELGRVAAGQPVSKGRPDTSRDRLWSRPLEHDTGSDQPVPQTGRVGPLYTRQTTRTRRKARSAGGAGR